MMGNGVSIEGALNVLYEIRQLLTFRNSHAISAMQWGVDPSSE